MVSNVLYFPLIWDDAAADDDDGDDDAAADDDGDDDDDHDHDGAQWLWIFLWVGKLEPEDHSAEPPMTQQ